MLPADGAAVALWLILAAAVLGCAIMHRQRLVALVLTGVAGLVTALVFLHFSAPDLALTQISVEVVSPVLMLLALALLPKTTPRESRPGRRARDVALALAAGVGITALAYAVMTRDPETIAWYYLANSLSAGGGANVVNVILVDFRGFDTYGEITVLAIAALGVAALSAGARRGCAPEGFTAPSLSRPMRPLILRVAAQWLLPLTLLVSVFIFMRGHDRPGGGFVAGLITAVALLTQYIALGFDTASARIPINYERAIGTGLVLACATGLAACLFGAPFLTSAHGNLQLPLLGVIPVSSATVFDLGVYLTVVGATMLTLARLSGLGVAATAAART
jgi:multicomponent K+:H+ antiporter subunit A